MVKGRVMWRRTEKVYPSIYRQELKVLGWKLWPGGGLGEAERRLGQGRGGSEKVSPSIYRDKSCNFVLKSWGGGGLAVCSAGTGIGGGRRANSEW